MTKDEAIQELHKGAVFGVGDCWFGVNRFDEQGKPLYHHYEFGRDWHEENDFDSVESLVVFLDEWDEDWHEIEISSYKTHEAKQ